METHLRRLWDFPAAMFDERSGYSRQTLSGEQPMPLQSIAEINTEAVVNANNDIECFRSQDIPVSQLGGTGNLFVSWRHNWRRDETDDSESRHIQHDRAPRVSKNLHMCIVFFANINNHDLVPL